MFAIVSYVLSVYRVMAWLGMIEPSGYLYELSPTPGFAGASLTILYRGKTIVKIKLLLRIQHRELLFISMGGTAVSNAGFEPRNFFSSINDAKSVQFSR